MSKHEDILPGGLADSKTPGDFDPDSLKEGRDHELEHTSNEGVAQEIAMDHLTEDPDYYKARKLSRRMKFHGMNISIETDKGETREWYDPHNDTHGSTTMKYPYGYIRMTDGDDGEHVDVYVGPSLEEDTVYVVRQNKAPDFKEYDEEKVMIGFESAKDAKQAYLVHYNSPKFFESMSSMDIDDFKARYIKKAIGDSPPQAAPQQAAPQQPMVPMFDPYDMNIPQSVQGQLASIGGMSDKEMVKLAQAVWGDGYEYRPISTNHVRAELRGFLQDQLEWLNLNPMAQVDPSMMSTPSEMPHSSDLSQMSGSGAGSSRDLLNEASLDGKISPDERLTDSNSME
jgi:hypothetical protein